MSGTSEVAGPGRLRLGERRRSGILLHPSSLPGPGGIGDIGGAERFLDFLAAAGQTVWQVLPLVPTGYGDSPYQGLGAFAGNPLLVSLEALASEGWLAGAELAGGPKGGGPVDYGAVIPWKSAALAAAAASFERRAPAARRRALEEFRAGNASWLDDFALFCALKQRHRGEPWWRWGRPLATRRPEALAAARRELDEAVRACAFAQFAFAEQWSGLRARCRERGVLLLGDLPLYPALDSAEVWARPHLFHLDGEGAPTVVAGVPPDYFSATGQLWGSPIYRWEEMAREVHAFFVERVRAGLGQVDALRLDHFRGFEAYWAVPAGAATAEAGSWRPGPGAPLFEALRSALGDLPLVAENLGVITPAVESLRRGLGLPGMAVLQFAFGEDPQAPSFLPHNYERDLVAYTGTHDNDTVLGWWASEGGDSTRMPESVRREKDRARRYLATHGREMNWVMIRAVLASVASTAVAPLQDVLGLGNEARMNRPSSPSGNWRWRLRAGDLAPGLAARLGELAGLYGRA
jgi:4-alpha-glucanotransferase